MYYITTSRPYTNASPHLGTAIDAVYGDVFARFWRRLLDGSVYYCTGTDEHSFKIADKAQELGISPKEYVNQKYQEFAKFYESLNISSDQFFQNSTPKHHYFSNLVWEKLSKKDLIYKKAYQGLYCKGCEDFYSESQLEDGVCPVHTNIPIQKIEEENYFFRLSQFKFWLKEEFLPNQIQVPDKTVIHEMQNFVDELKDISISRDRSRLVVDWAVPVYQDPKHLMYVWFEALLTYLTPIIDDDLIRDFETAKQNQEQIFQQLKNFLPQDLMIIGRDNSKFHLVILPSILKALDLPTPKACLIHGMITDELGRKFSKSLGNGVDLELIKKNFGTEGVRYFILKELNSIGDTAFNWDRLLESFNANLGNNLGNLLVRLTNLIEKKLDGYLDLDKNLPSKIWLI
jgi:methionyl-tRNA synthetase